MKLWSITTLFFFLIFFHLYRTRYNANPCKFVKQGKDWKTEAKVIKKKKKEWVVTSELVRRVHFHHFIFQIINI